jgi:catecholate siderophore receptor
MSNRWSARRNPLVAAMLFALYGSSGSAEEPVTPGTQETPLPKISVHGEEETYRADALSSPKYAAPLRDTPQSVTVVPAEVIEARGALTLRDVMRNVSGISLVAGEGGGARGDNFRIRGFAANTDMFIDGMRDIAQYSNRDPFNLEQVEVVKGPSGAFAGRGSTGGTINQVSKLPLAESVLGGDLSLGTDSTRRITTDWNQAIGMDSALRLNLLYHESEVTGRDVTENERWGIAPSFSFGLGTPTRVTLSYYQLEQDNITDYGLPTTAGQLVVDVDHSNWYGFRDLNHEEERAQTGTARIDHDFGERATLRSQFRYMENDLFSIVSPPRQANATANTVARNPNVRDTLNTFAANQTDLTLRFGNGAARHSVATGLEIARETYDQQAYLLTPAAPLDNLTDPDPDTPYDPIFGAGTRTENAGDTLAVYAFDTVSVGEQWVIIGGLRWDRYDAKTDSYPASGAAVARERSDDETTWRAAAVYKPRENSSVYVSAGTSFNPSAEAGTLNNDALALLPPEESMSYEVGTKWDVLDERLSLAFAVFRIEKTNARTPGLPGEPVTVLDGKQRVNGFEVSAAGAVTERWQLLAGYTYLDSEITESNNPLEQGNDIGNTPPHTFSLWSSHRLLPNLEIGAGAQYVSERTVSNTVTAELDAYWLFDAMAAYTLSDTISLRLNLYNLADEFYFDRVHGGGSHAVPGPGRSALLSASVTF